MSNVRNSVSLIGRIPSTDKIKLTYSEAQDPKHNMIRGAISVRRSYKKPDEKFYPEDLINFVAFGHTAKYINDYIGRGGMMAITGELRRENDYTGNDGQLHRGGYSVFIDDATKLGDSTASGTTQKTNTVAQAPVNPFLAGNKPAAAQNPFMTQKAVY